MSVKSVLVKMETVQLHRLLAIMTGEMHLIVASLTSIVFVDFLLFFILFKKELRSKGCTENYMVQDIIDSEAQRLT